MRLGLLLVACTVMIAGCHESRGDVVMRTGERVEVAVAVTDSSLLTALEGASLAAIEPKNERAEYFCTIGVADIVPSGKDQLRVIGAEACRSYGSRDGRIIEVDGHTLVVEWLVSEESDAFSVTEHTQTEAWFDPAIVPWLSRSGVLTDLTATTQQRACDHFRIEPGVEIQSANYICRAKLPDASRDLDDSRAQSSFETTSDDILGRSLVLELRTRGIPHEIRSGQVWVYESDLEQAIEAWNAARIPSAVAACIAAGDVAVVTSQHLGCMRPDGSGGTCSGTKQSDCPPLATIME